MKISSKKLPHKKLLKLQYGLLVVLVVGLIASIFYCHYYEYQAITFKFADGSNATMSRHNFNEMTASQKQAFLNPVNENVLHACVGNLTDQRIVTPSIDFWPGGSERASNPYLVSSVTSLNEIMGRITNDIGNDLELRTTSGHTITVTYPLNALSNYNDNYAPHEGVNIDTGDMIYVSYDGKIQNYTIATDQIISSSLILKGNAKLGQMTKY